MKPFNIILIALIVVEWGYVLLGPAPAPKPPWMPCVVEIEGKPPIEMACRDASGILQLLPRNLAFR